MKTVLSITSVLAALAMVALPARATNYLDATGDFTGGVGALDITSVSVVNDATTLTFTINLNGDPTAQTWYNYYIGISENLFSGVGGNLNGTGGWGHNFQMSTGGMDYFIGSWGTGASLLTWAPSAWTTSSATGSENTSSVTASVDLSALGLSAGNSFTFDVLTADTGSDTGLDALSDSVSRTWGNTSFDTGANALTYTVEPVPEPATLALLSGGVILLLVQRRRVPGNRGA